jgi:hypothetical protein
VSNDAGRIAEFMADDWVLVSDSGVTSAERFLAVIRSGELTYSGIVSVGVSRVRVYGDTAVVTAPGDQHRLLPGPRFDADEWTADVFVRRDGRWLCTLTHIAAATPPRRPPGGKARASTRS